MSMNTALGELPSTAAHAHTGAWVASVLRSRIAEGQLVPGTKLSEQALSASLGVSRNTLREAFTVLDGELIVTRIPNRGVFVASPGRPEIMEIYRVRRILEPAAALWGPGPDIAELRLVVAEARDARTRGSVPQMAAANQRFHEALILGTGSTGLVETMSRVLAQMRLVFHAMSNAPDFHSHYVELNAELLELLDAGKRAQAAERLRSYLDEAEEELLSQFSPES